jgi:Ser/Thr protein kinase RdoA (MazF antagonist)
MESVQSIVGAGLTAKTRTAKMSNPNLDLIARAVLNQYGFSNAVLNPLGNHGGFSGASLWRVKESGGDWCLRAWPAQQISGQLLNKIHFLMKLARDQGLLIVPKILASRTGSTWVEKGDRIWDLTSWMPGIAANPGEVNREQVEAAFTALALLHQAWAAVAPAHGSCPAVNRRLESYRVWDASIQTTRLECCPDDPRQKWAERAQRLLRAHAAKISVRLYPWVDRVVPLQFCLCDIWNDHVLFDGNTVTGLIDYGGVKIDHVAVDLARLLGSMVEDQVDLRVAGLEAYKRIRPLSFQEEELVSVLDETGTLVGLITWLKWLYVDGKQFDDRNAAAQRLRVLVERVNRWECC